MFGHVVFLYALDTIMWFVIFVAAINSNKLGGFYLFFVDHLSVSGLF